jgi:hypothetical protein
LGRALFQSTDPVVIDENALTYFAGGVGNLTDMNLERSLIDLGDLPVHQSPWSGDQMKVSSVRPT